MESYWNRSHGVDYSGWRTKDLQLLRAAQSVVCNMTHNTPHATKQIRLIMVIIS